MRRTWLLGLALCAAAPAVTAQAPQLPSHLYLSYSKVNYAELAQWTSDLFEHHKPILDSLRADGTIRGWRAWMHHTGGEYNVVLSIASDDWISLDTFWAEYLGRLEAQAPEAMNRMMGMAEGHFDEIWDVAEDAASNYRYDARYQIGFDDIPAWEAFWADAAAPVLGELMEEGLLTGWVRLNHNTGGRYNWQVVFLFDEWDDMDDFAARFEAALFANAEAYERVARNILAHDDVLWRAVPAPAEN
jgi:hypothetical protein